MGDDVADRPAGAGGPPVPLSLDERRHQLGYRFDGMGPGVGVGLKAGMQTHGTGPLGGRYGRCGACAGCRVSGTLSYAAREAPRQCFRVTIVGPCERLECQDGGSVRASLIQIAVDEGESVESRRRAGGFAGTGAGRRPISSSCPSCGPRVLSPTRVRERGRAARGPDVRGDGQGRERRGRLAARGSIPERDADGALYNTSLVFSPAGDLAAAYRKIHRFGFDKGEAVLMGAGARAGDGPLCPRRPSASPPATTSASPNCSAVSSTPAPRCFVVPAGWPARRRAHWTLLARARAVENQAYVLACGPAGTHAGVPQAGSQRSWWTRGARCSRRRGRARRSSPWTSTRRRSRPRGSSSRP